MIDRVLFDILEPAYRPCPEFSGACRGACRWEPSKGLVPCAFGGAIGALEEVALIVVTAEPGDPPDNAGYRGTPRRMLCNSLRIFRRAMQKGSLERRANPSPFHRNMRRILDLFWPNENLEQQLRKTWTTNAVLCPTEQTGGKHPPRVERACAERFLAQQLLLFPNAFVLALGGKARRRMRAAGLEYHAVALHPSARGREDRKFASWKSAARKFHGDPDDLSASPQMGSGRHTPVFDQSVHPVDRELTSAIRALSPDAQNFFLRLMKSDRFECRAGRMQLMIFWDGEKVGGFNTKTLQWYFSRIFVDDRGDAGIMQKFGFERVEKDQKHSFWSLRGPAAPLAFEKALVEMIGVELSGSATTRA